MGVENEVIPTGFTFGAAKVERFTQDDATGAVNIGVTTPKGTVVIYVTKTGKVRVFKRGEGEMFVIPDRT